MKIAFSRTPAQPVGTIATGIVPLPAGLKSAQPQAMICMIGPEEAQRLLAVNTANRRPAPVTIARYARDIAHGHFDLSNDAISIYTSGTLATGQHRCRAVIDAGKPIPSLVLLGLPEASALKLDQPVTRKQYQNLQVSASLRGTESDVSASDIATAKMLVGAVYVGLTMDELQSVLIRYREPLGFAKEHAASSLAPMRSAVAAAFLAGVDRDALARFCTVFATGITDGPHESAAIRLREKLPTIAGTNDGRIDQQRMTMNAIKHFVNGHDAKRLIIPEQYLYPLGTAVEGAGA